jgi:hypothetical protein
MTKLAAKKKEVTIPNILTANTYFWSPCSRSGGRRLSEERRQAEVASFLESIGFEVERSGDNVNGEGYFEGIGSVEVSFYYYESCSNVYKTLQICRDGKRSNITTIKKIVKQQ